MTKNTDMNGKQFIRDIFSENGRGSSKRVVGAVAILVCLACIAFLVFTEGGTVIVADLLQTAFIISASLLGLSSVTSIWKNNKLKQDNDEKD